MVKAETRNHTNTKSYNLLNNDFIYEITYKTEKSAADFTPEQCLMGRTGYNMGIFTQKTSTLNEEDSVASSVKWCWFKHVGEEIHYDDIYFGLKDTDNAEYIVWWINYIKKSAPKDIDETIVMGLVNRWAFFYNNLDLQTIEDTEIRDWAINFEKLRKESQSYIGEVVKVKIIKTKHTFTMYINDIFYKEKECGKLYDYSTQTIFIGVANPYSFEENKFWFNGEILEVKIYHDSIETDDNLYLWFDFERNSKFKTFDKSGNGNHGEMYETEEFKYEKHIEFNKIARPAKIV
jgi:hypothetical protein